MKRLIPGRKCRRWSFITPEVADITANWSLSDRRPYFVAIIWGCIVVIGIIIVLHLPSVCMRLIADTIRRWIHVQRGRPHTEPIYTIVWPQPLLIVRSMEKWARISRETARFTRTCDECAEYERSGGKPMWTNRDAWCLQNVLLYCHMTKQLERY